MLSQSHKRIWTNTFVKMKLLIVISALIITVYGQTTVTTTTTQGTTSGPKPTLPPELQEKVCRDLIPLHPGSPGPQNTTAPYHIIPEKRRVANGERIYVKIYPTVEGEKFNGFMVQARSADDFRNYQIFGRWIVDEAGLNDAQSCINFNDTAFSDSKESWDFVTLTWVAPSTGRGEVTFFTAITKTFTVFWIDLFSVFTVVYGD